MLERQERANPLHFSPWKRCATQQHSQINKEVTQEHRAYAVEVPHRKQIVHKAAALDVQYLQLCW